MGALPRLHFAYAALHESELPPAADSFSRAPRTRAACRASRPAALSARGRPRPRASKWGSADSAVFKEFQGKTAAMLVEVP